MPATALSAEQFVAFLSELLYVLLFLLVGLEAVRRPRRASVDIALLFACPGLLVLGTWAQKLLDFPNSEAWQAFIGSLFVVMPYFLVRLVHDFMEIRRWMLHATLLGCAASVGVLFAVETKDRAPWLVLLIVGHFMVVILFAAVAFARGARHANGVTRRRLQLVAGGSVLLAVVLLSSFLLAALPSLAAVWTPLLRLAGLGSGILYVLGFTPPALLRRAWQEPELRALLGQAARLPRLPTTEEIIRELEKGCAASLGAPHATIARWDSERELLVATLDGAQFANRPGELLGGKAFVAQTPLFSEDAVKDDPAHRELYQRTGALALLAAPITAGERKLGVLVVFSPRASIFAEDDLRLVKMLADQAAMILESRALLDEASQVAARAEANRLKDDFLSAAAHDLKSPLTTLIASAQLLERRARNREGGEADLPALHRMGSEADRLRRLVEDLLQVSRLDGGGMALKLVEGDWVVTVRRVFGGDRSERHPMVLDAPATLPGRFDPARIEQLLENLLGNAIKYSPDGGPISVRLWQEGETARLTINDRGIGIPEADLPHIFERYHRGRNVDDRKFAGMGLGLFICRGIVKQHHGEIRVESGPAGSTFQVQVPLSPP